MQERLEYRGAWYLPGQPDVQLYGALTFSPESGAELEVVSTTNAPAFEAPNDMSEPPLILGTAIDGTPITLSRCMCTSSHRRYPGLGSATYWAHNAFVGCHFESPDEIAFKGLHVDYSSLGQWIDLPGLTTDHSNRFADVVVRLKSPPPFPLASHDDFDFSLVPTPEYREHLGRRRQVQVGHRPIIGISANRTRRYDDFERPIRDMQRFLTLATAEPVRITELLGFIEDSPVPVRVLYQPIQGRKPHREHDRHRMHFRYDETRDRVPELLHNWMTHTERLEHVCNLFFGIVHSPPPYLEQTFLAFARAIETYHRLTRDYLVVPQDEFRGIRRGMLKQVPGKYKSRVRARMGQVNMPTLRDRLTDLVEEHVNPPDDFMMDRSAFVDKVVSTRNFYTHYSPHLRYRAAGDTELFVLTRQLGAVLCNCLLSEMGFTPEEAWKRMCRHRRSPMDIGVDW